jgi:hypothetical protein
MFRHFLSPFVLLFLSLAAIPAQAGLVTIGTMAAWQATPAQSLDDKTFTWLGSSANWNGSELISVSSNATGDIYSLNIDTMTTFTGPITLTVDYQIDITSRNVFDLIGVDTDTLSPTTTVYKDVFSSLSLLQNAMGFGGGDLASLTSINGMPAWSTLPAIQQIWVRDTITLSGGGQINSASNSVLQAVPEPSGIALAGLAAAALAARRLRGGRGGRPMPEEPSASA